MNDDLREWYGDRVMVAPPLSEIAAAKAFAIRCGVTPTHDDMRRLVSGMVESRSVTTYPLSRFTEGW